MCFRISLSSRGYFTNRLRGMSRKFHRSNFLLKGDCRQRCKKSCTRRSCFFWSNKALAFTWLLQYGVYEERQGSCRDTETETWLLHSAGDLRFNAILILQTLELFSVCYPVSQDVSHMFCGPVRFSGVSEVTQQV